MESDILGLSYVSGNEGVEAAIFILGCLTVMKKKIRSLIHKTYGLLRLRLFFRPHIMSAEKTIRYIIRNRCSIARFGDGEFYLMLNEKGIGFQEKSPELAKKLDSVLLNHEKNLLICIPGSFNRVRNRTAESKAYWLNWGLTDRHQEIIVRHLWQACGKDYRFGDAQITRPYIAVRNKQSGDRVFPLLSKLWDGRDVLIVEGRQTRMGVGNDLLANTKSIRRILAPATNAFSSYNDILASVLENAVKDTLVLLALGPTATVLAEELSRRGIQALDLGHIDLEYEWYLRRATKRELISGKFVNELGTENPVDTCDDPGYLAQIIAEIG